MATIPVVPTASNAHDSTHFARLLEPGLRKIFFETYSELPEQFSRLYNVGKSTKAKEVDYGLGAFGDWTKRADEYDTVAYAKLSAGDERVYTHEAFTKGFMITREMYDDEQYKQMNKMPKALARAGRAQVEKHAMTPFIKGFSTGSSDDDIQTGDYKIYDGKTLFSTKHKLLDASGKFGENVVTGALNDVNLKIAMQCMRETVDEANNLVQFVPDTLIVPPALEHVAKALINSTQIVGSNNNDVNTVKGAMNIVVMDYLGATAGGSDTAWYIMDSKRHEMNFFWRIKPEFKSTEEFDNFVAKYRGYMRYSYGCSDWRGIVGSKGV